MSDDVEMCHCGKPLHYNSKIIEELIRKQIKAHGENVDVKLLGGKTYSVPRHYIALHGIKGYQLPELGFVEVVDE